MKILRTTRLKITTSIIICLLPLISIASDIDSITNYKSQSVQSDLKSVVPYTVQEIILKLANTLDSNGVYEKYDLWFVPAEANDSSNVDPRALAFDKEKFGNCDELYITKERSHGGFILDATLQFLFTQNEKLKENRSSNLKNLFNYVNDPGNFIYGDKRCQNRAEYVANLYELINAVNNNPSTILKERQRIKELAHQEEIFKQNELHKIAVEQSKIEKDRLDKLEIQRSEQEEKQKEKARSDESKFIIFILVAIIGSVWVWHKFIRRRCPECKAISPKLLNETELDSWLGTKEVSEDLGNGKTRKKIVNTTFAKISRRFECTKCGNTWEELSKEEK